MTVATRFYDWQRNGAPDDLPAGCSPNLRVLEHELERRWPFFTSIGCRSARPVRGSTSVRSTHTWGAAIDMGYPAEADSVVESQVAGFLVAWSDELGVQAVHDYRRCRIWRAGRTDDPAEACTGWWRAQRRSTVTGMGQVWANHLHIETGPALWFDMATPAERGVR